MVLSDLEILPDLKIVLEYGINWYLTRTAVQLRSLDAADSKMHVRGRARSGNSVVNLRHLFQALLVEKRRLPYRYWVCLCLHVLSKPPPEEHDLRLLRRALFPGRY